MVMITKENLSQLKVGDKVIYKSKSNITPEASYDGVVVDIFKNHILLEISPKSDTSKGGISIWGESIKYPACAMKNTLGVHDFIWK